MGNLVLFGLFIVLLLAAQFTSAKTAEEVIEKYIWARGGSGKLASLKSIYMEGIKEVMGKEVIVKVTKERDKLSRIEIGTGPHHSVVLVTDQGAWITFRQGSQYPDRIQEEDLAGLQTEMDIAGPLVDYIAKGHKAELLGKDIVEGHTCYKIKLTTRAGKEMRYWLDTATYLVNQSTAVTIRENGTVDSESLTLYRNYQDVDGIKFAHSCETKITGTNSAVTSDETLFYKILVNPAIDPKMYQFNNQS